MKYIILDRDGVINEDSDAYIKSPDEFIPIEGSLQAIARLNRAGYKVLIATNQSGIARGYYDIATLDAMHAKLYRLLAAEGGSVERIEFCPHGPDDQCTCRKPLPGMIEKLIARYQLDVSELIVVGDSLRDLEAARVVGAKAVLVKTGKGQKTWQGINTNELWANLPVYENLSTFVDQLLKQD